MSLVLPRGIEPRSQLYESRASPSMLWKPHSSLVASHGVEPRSLGYEPSMVARPLARINWWEWWDSNPQRRWILSPADIPILYTPRCGGRQRNRTATGVADQYAFQASPVPDWVISHGTDGGTRTHRNLILSQARLPITPHPHIGYLGGSGWDRTNTFCFSGRRFYQVSFRPMAGSKGIEPSPLSGRHGFQDRFAPCALPPILVPSVGLEPTLAGLSILCLCQLGYDGSVCFFQSDTGITDSGSTAYFSMTASAYGSCLGHISLTRLR